MDIEEQVKEAYDTHGCAYQEARKHHSSRLLYNDFLEVPAMIENLGDINGKFLLDIGCGTGAHARAYTEKNAVVYGIDISQTMLLEAQKNCQANLQHGSILKIPFPNNFFDIGTASFVIQHVQDIDRALGEVNRVLKPGARFLYSEHSPLSIARTKHEDKRCKYFGIGHIRDKENGEITLLGRYWFEGMEEMTLLPNFTVPLFRRMFRTHLAAIRQAGFELVDFVDCKPIPELEGIDPDAYKIMSSYPVDSIYVCEKK
jgi:ubiquinone/menaquinone biosynthesis C-methylase UbiE